MEVLGDQKGTEGVDLEHLSKRFWVYVFELLLGVEVGSVEQPGHVDDQVRTRCLLGEASRRMFDAALVSNVERQDGKPFRVGLRQGTQRCRRSGLSAGGKHHASWISSEELPDHCQPDPPTCALNQGYLWARVHILSK